MRQRASEGELTQSPRLPALFHSADKAALSAQRWYVALSGGRLGALVTVAVLAALSNLIDRWSATIALAPIVLAVACEIILLVRRPDRDWYRARAVAETAKSLAWRFRVGGSPFGPHMTVDEATSDLVSRLQGLTVKFSDLELPPALHEQVTPEMRRLRSLSRDERIAGYQDGRLVDQQRWYATKAAWNQKWATGYQVGLVVVELAALGTAVLSAAIGLPISLYSFLSALAIAGVGWLQIRQHRSLSESYSLASHELAGISSLSHSIQTEEDWESFVDRAENTISREHKLWLASHSRPS